MEEQIKDLRRLVIKAYHMNEVEWGEHNDITVDGKMTVSKEMIEEFVESEPLIEKIDIQIIKPGEHDRWTNTMMDFHKSAGENWRRYYTYNYGCVCNFNRCGC